MSRVLDMDVTSLDSTSKAGFKFGSGALIGIRKLAQTYTIMFLTAVGSKPLDPEFGAPLGFDFLGGNNVVQSDLFNLLNVANMETLSQLRDDQTLLTDLGILVPDDEYVVASELKEVLKQNSSTIKVTIQVTVKAGASYTVIIPIKVI